VKLEKKKKKKKKYSKDGEDSDVESANKLISFGSLPSYKYVLYWLHQVDKEFVLNSS
jgi:hypothetical protein